MTATSENLFSVAIFPYLKTSGPVRIGPYTFRSTDDVEGLGQAESNAVAEVTRMLYTQNNVRVRSASYAVVPQIHVSGVSEIPDVLKRVHSLLAYLYGSPGDPLGDPFLGFECATLLLLTPGRVTRFLVEPEHHTIIETPLQIKWEAHQAQGYDGLLNFNQPFWVVEGARIYPPVPHITLNISQDLAVDCSQVLTDGTGHELVRLLSNDERHIGERIFTAVGWYNATNRADVSEGEALINLAIAFESLLDLPPEEKTSRFIDSVSLLLGRVPRLEAWVRQFYDSRSQVAHEGKLSHGRFIIQQSGKTSQNLVYHPLLVFGREIFRLCVATITHGAYLAEKRNIAAKLRTNSERFQELCRVLDAGPMSDTKQELAIRRLVAEINQYRFVHESGLSVAVIIGAVQRAAKSLIDLEISLNRMEEAQLSRFAALGTKDELVALEALSEIHSHPHTKQALEMSEPERIIWALVEIAWMYTFQNYFHRKKKQEESSGQT